MYKVGDKIVYPMHGAGIVERIENKHILGRDRDYYVLHVPGDDMKIMIPVDQVDVIGVRTVIDKNDFEKVVALLKEPSSKMPSNWNRRYRANMDKLRTGDICEVAEVVRNLTRTEVKKQLSTGEKKLLANARHILVTEMVLAADIAPDEADRILDTAISS